MMLSDEQCKTSLTCQVPLQVFHVLAEFCIRNWSLIPIWNDDCRRVFGDAAE